MHDRPHSIILNGFDRSGSSAISRGLAKHPGIELFMQPFNSGPVREKMYQLWDDTVASPEDIRFFEGLEKGELIRDYIHSHWFEKHSTSQDFVSGQIHITKTTINHFLIDWCQSRFEEIHQWAIWRDPYEIMDSIVHNDFASAWYGDAVEPVLKAAQQSGVLSPRYSKWGAESLSDIESLALLISVRSYFLFYHVQVDRVIYYREFCESPSQALSPFLRAYGLGDLEATDRGEDLNIIGQRRDSSSSHIPEWKQDERIRALFEPLFQLMKSKFPETRLL